jgi:hypothetical protein
MPGRSSSAAPVLARCVVAGTICTIRPGRRTCVRCTTIRRRCASHRASMVPAASIRTQINDIRQRLASILTSLRSLEDVDDGDPLDPADPVASFISPDDGACIDRCFSLLVFINSPP